MSITLADLVVRAFDEAAKASDDPRIIAELATEKVNEILNRAAHLRSREKRISRFATLEDAHAVLSGR